MSIEQLRTTSGALMEGPLVITPQVFGDDRGFFHESWNQRRFDEAVGASVCFVQHNHSRSSRGVLRGLHYQLEPGTPGQGGALPSGEIFDVAVDVRRSSATFGQWVAGRLSAESHNLLWVPVGFAHGFLTLSETARCNTKRAATGARPASALSASFYHQSFGNQYWALARPSEDKPAAADPRAPRGCCRTAAADMQ